MPRKTRAQRARKHNLALDAAKDLELQNVLALSVETDRADCWLRELQRAHIKQLAFDAQLRKLPLEVQDMIITAHANLPVQRYLALRDTAVEGTAAGKKKLQDLWVKLAPSDREHVYQRTDQYNY